MHSLRFRCFSSGLYPARVRNQIVIFDLINDKFHLLSDDLSTTLIQVYRCQLDKPLYCGGQSLFTREQVADDKYRLLSARTVMGVNVNFWQLSSSAVCFRHYREIAYMLHCLHRVHGWINKGVTRALENMATREANRGSTRHLANMDVTRLIHALNAASLLYPRQTRCLAWSVTLIYALLPQGVPLTLNIGVQNYPFYAHAWVERQGQILGDDNALPEKMVTIFTRTWGAHV